MFYNPPRALEREGKRGGGGSEKRKKKVLFSWGSLCFIFYNLCPKTDLLILGHMKEIPLLTALACVEKVRCHPLRRNATHAVGNKPGRMKKKKKSQAKKTPHFSQTSHLLQLSKVISTNHQWGSQQLLTSSLPVIGGGGAVRPRVRVFVSAVSFKSKSLPPSCS